MTLAASGSMPLVEPQAAVHSLRLSERIAEVIAQAGGWIPFSRYMQIALYEPGLGYYSAGAVKFGASGDFVTAPEISPFFATACARVFDRLLRAIGGGDWLELGPGSGRFAVDVLHAMRALQTPVRQAGLLEVSADLRAVQQAALSTAPIPVTWFDHLPKEFSGVMFGNEVMDALPCERFVVRGGQFWRLGVGQTAQSRSERSPTFEWRARPADGACNDDAVFQAHMAQLAEWVSARGGLAAAQWPDGYCGEWHPALSAWVKTLADSLSAGALVLADYGLPRQQLYHPDRVTGSLRCHHRHHAHADPFLWPGLTDITAWIDFTTVAEAGLAAGLHCAQFTTQTAFLLASGSNLSPATPREAQGLRQLLLPGEMGEAIKFMVLTRDPAIVASHEGPGFALQDLRDSLLL